MFTEQKKISKIGEKIGFLFGFLIFTTLFFLFLNYFRKIPPHWGYFHLLGITASITILGLGVKKWIK